MGAKLSKRYSRKSLMIFFTSPEFSSLSVVLTKILFRSFAFFFHDFSLFTNMCPYGRKSVILLPTQSSRATSLCSSSQDGSKGKCVVSASRGGISLCVTKPYTWSQAVPKDLIPSDLEGSS